VIFTQDLLLYGSREKPTVSINKTAGKDGVHNKINNNMEGRDDER